MNRINKIASYDIGAVVQNKEPEAPSQQAHPAANFGIANTADIFESNVSNHLDLHLFETLRRTEEDQLKQHTAESEKLLGEKESLALLIDKMSELKGSEDVAIPEIAKQSVIQNNDVPPAVSFDPDIRKLINEE